MIKTIKTFFKTSLLLVSTTILLFSFSSPNDATSHKIAGDERVSFKIKGTGSKGIMVTIGIGKEPGKGAFCSGVSSMTTASFTGNVGDVVYDGKTRRVITRIYKEMQGQTINLADYY
jgi:hypothetical protein